MSKKNEVFVISAPLPDNMTRNDIKRLKKYIKQELIAALIEFVESEAQPHKTMLDGIRDARVNYLTAHLGKFATRLYLDTASHRKLCDELTHLYGTPFFSLYGDHLGGLKICHTEESGWWVE
jgi:hypothetical protein